MGFVNLTKQFAQAAIEDQVKDVLGVKRPAEAPVAAEKPAVSAVPEDVGAAILKQVQAMQAALKENEELVVLFHSGLDPLRVMDIFVPAPQVVVLAGLDAEKNITRVISPAHALQLTCKVMKIQPPAVPARIRFLTPKTPEKKA
jgi:hypothetical protein